MKAIRPLPLVAFAVVAGVVGWFVNVMVAREGWPAIRFPWSAALTMGVLCLVAVGFGWGVYRTRTGKAPRAVEPLVAARVLVLGQACAHAGAVVAGWHAGVLAASGLAAGAGMSQTVVASLVMTGCGLALVGCGILVEYFCRIPPDEGEGLEPHR
ncbi:DUF3180 domain-containing protein [Falsarthrobacter nasiphocae]|uniref:DUF3180 domain-containing protein n=1 Tax=Falsarthrobacter nasiphocae TaxID=189863 RepID=A0AAE4C5Y3_9MICC|nr:DUF3180 domain-containing protein [Falsarthrobacter nasiphocae]MDR6891983.1 hypothetical protein [Falsarthrobacter nasiphocae]